MNLKMKSYKKSIINSDIKRFWVLSLLYGGVIFFSTFFDFYLNREPYGNNIPYDFVSSRFFAYNCLSNFFGLAAGAIIALILFSYLYSVNAISFYHGLPFKRKSIFISKLISGILLLTVPVLVNFAVVVLTKLCGSAIQIRYYSLFYWLGNQLIYSLFAFACVTFSVMISGNILSLFVTCFLLSISPAVIISFADLVCTNYLFGYAYNPTNYLTYFYITPDILLFKLRGLIYVISIPILLTISYFMYKRRDLERCGEAIVFPKLKIAFIYFAGLLGGIFSYFYFSIWHFKTLLFMLPFAIIAIIIANMINRRGITLKGAFIHTLIFTAFVLSLLGAFRIDIIGFEKRIPFLEKVESVTVVPERYYSYMQDENLLKLAITDKDDIEKVIAYHKHKVYESHIETDYMTSNVNISYKLTNGKTLKRAYKVNFTYEKEYFESVASIDNIKSILYPIYKAENIKITNINLNNFLNSVNFYPNSPITAELISAMEEDIKNVPYEENTALLWSSMYCDAPLYVEIEYKSPNNDNLYNLSYYFPISLGFTNTIELLKKYGYYDLFMSINDVDLIGIDKDGDGEGDLRVKDWTVDEIITDRKEMADILEKLLTLYRQPYDERDTTYGDYIFLDKSGSTHSFTVGGKW